MSLLQNPWLRTKFRQSGLKRIYYRIFSPRNRNYEKTFSDGLLNAIHSGDCVWDVGANVGFYTQTFAERVGASGTVIAIEPFQATFAELSSAVRQFPQVRCLPVALGAENTEIRVDPVAPLSTGNSLAHPSSSKTAEKIRVCTGRTLIADGLPIPTILKIDVEGFEEDVLHGFGEALQDRKCRGVFVEVHYEALANRGYPRAPARLVSRLRDLGFRTHWLDRSHLAGLRS
jgi:FkbM family methyltransferase